MFDYEHKRIGLAPSINFMKPGSRNFINWALSMFSLQNLKAVLNVEEVTMGNQILMTTFVVSFALFAVYFLIVKKNSVQEQPKKVKARLFKDEAEETEIEAL